jgi:hypothetical protein
MAILPASAIVEADQTHRQECSLRTRQLMMAFAPLWSVIWVGSLLALIGGWPGLELSKPKFR